MAKLIYEVMLPKNKAQLEGFFLQLFKPKQKHLIIKILNDYINKDDLKETLEKYQENIKKYKKNKSIVIIYEYYKDIPDFIPVAPTEDEAIDIIEFEEIERDLMFNDKS